MTVQFNGKNKAKNRRTGYLICDEPGCDARTQSYPCPSAGPNLDICEAAHKAEGWTYTIGFVSMMLGPRTWCPEHG